MDLEQQLAAIAPLADPLRRRLYLYVGARGAEVSRDEAARALGIARPLAVFHLDKLAEHGLIETSYRRVNRRSGPGAGRPAKLYRRAQRPVSISIPERHYELAGQLLLETVAETGKSAPVKLQRRAAALGQQIGREWKAAGF